MDSGTVSYHGHVLDMSFYFSFLIRKKLSTIVGLLMGPSLCADVVFTKNTLYLYMCFVKCNI